MSQMLKVIVYEPAKKPRSLSRNINPELVPLLDRDSIFNSVIFNADGSLCNDYEMFNEDLSEDELIGFHTDCLTNDTRTFLESLPAVSVKKQKKIERLKKVKEIKQNVKFQNKLKKLRKKKSNTAVVDNQFNGDFVAVPISDPVSPHNRGMFTTSDPKESTLQPRKKMRYFKKFVNSNPNSNIKKPNVNNKAANSNQKKKGGKNAFSKTPTKPDNSLQTPNTSRLPAFIRNSWKKKKNLNRNVRNVKNMPADNNLDYIPIGNYRNINPRSQNNGFVPPLTNNRYFNIDKC